MRLSGWSVGAWWRLPLRLLPGLIGALFPFLDGWARGCQEGPVRPCAWRELPFQDPRESGEEGPQFSGLAWYGESHLILLPQWAHRMGSQGWFGDRGVGRLFALEKGALLEGIAAPRPRPLVPRPIPWRFAPELRELMEKKGFQGFEAIVFAGDTFWVTMETKRKDGDMVGRLARGRLVRGEKGLEARLEELSPLEMRARENADGRTVESLAVWNGALYAFYEDNSTRAEAQGWRISPGMELLGRFPVPPLCPRLSDLTAPDREGRVWGVITDKKPLRKQLVELQLGPGGVTRTPAPLMALEPAAREHSWEGVARLEEGGRLLGLLLISDDEKRSLLGFVPAASLPSTP